MSHIETAQCLMMSLDAEPNLCFHFQQLPDKTFCLCVGAVLPSLSYKPTDTKSFELPTKN